MVLWLARNSYRSIYFKIAQNSPHFKIQQTFLHFQIPQYLPITLTQKIPKSPRIWRRTFLIPRKPPHYPSLDKTSPYLKIPSKTSPLPLHPITYREVLSAVCSSALFTVGCGLCCLFGVDQQVLVLERLNQVSVPDHSTIRHLWNNRRKINLITLIEAIKALKALSCQPFFGGGIKNIYFDVWGVSVFVLSPWC